MKGALDIYILGAGKVGGGLARALRAKGGAAKVRLRAARQGIPRTPIDADLLILAVRDGQLPALVSELVAKKALTSRTAVVHCAGALDVTPLVPLRAIAAGVAQMHPMISFATPRAVPSLARGQVHVAGDARAVRLATRVAKLLGMTPRTIAQLDRIAYHAAAGLVANGAAALALAGSTLLQRGGVSAEVAPLMLGPLLRSVADNVERLGLPGALTGPVRRGDAAGVQKHLDVIASRVPDLVPLYRALVLAQVPMARELGDAPPASFDAILGAIGAPSHAGAKGEGAPRKKPRP